MRNADMTDEEFRVWAAKWLPPAPRCPNGHGTMATWWGCWFCLTCCHEIEYGDWP